MSDRFFTFSSAWQPVAQTADGRSLLAIGDLHGATAHLDAMLTVLRPVLDEARAAGRAPLLVCLGDYIDRGPDSLGVLRRVAGLHAEFGCETVLLKGNHDQFLLELLTDPAAGHELIEAWLGVRGGTTLAQIGLGPEVRQRLTMAELIATARSAVGPDILAILRDLELTRRVGGWLLVHAGLRPGVPLAAQDPVELINIREPFLSATDWDLPVRVVHGHTIAGHRLLPHRVGTDTGVIRTGVLSALQIEDGRLRWLCVTDDPSLERFRALPDPGSPPAYGPLSPIG